ncbi:phage tail protein [Nocardia sp. NPDC059246]|uniref:Gp37-like protein n=1 Tax=unclassified Nocardia TaxID=2637762 RepID=UPI0036BD5AB7
MATATVETIDFDAVFAEITERILKEKERRLLPPLVRLFDGDWNLRGYVKKEYNAKFQFLANDAGVGQIEMPLDYYLSKWLVDVDGRQTTNVHITVDKDGARWSGSIDELLVVKDEQGKKFVRVTFKHDYEHLKHILVYSNPFLPPEVQFPKLWVLFGRARWCLKTTLLVNLLRLNSSIWVLPDNPLDASQWFNFDQRTWTQVVKPDLTPDNSVGGIVHGRFKYVHDASKKVVADAQLTWECRRYLKDEDEPPWPGADLMNGCLVWDLIDNSGFNTGTSFGGDMFGGLVQAVTDFFVDQPNGVINDTRRTLPDPNFPPELSTPGYKGTLPECPGVIFYESEHSGISSSEFSWKPATDTSVVGGGHSMPGVNEMISAAVQALGDLTSAIPGVPALGGIFDAIAKMFYTDVFMAFGKWKSPVRATRLSTKGFHFHEKKADGADTGYTIAWLLAMRAGLWATRETTRHKLTIPDGACGWVVGQRGHGHFFLGDRVGSVILGMPHGKIFVDRVSEITLSWSRTESPTWAITIGESEPEDPIAEAWAQFEEILSILSDLGAI